MQMQMKLKEMRLALQAAQRDINQFRSYGNDSAGRRVRAVLMDVVKAATKLRSDIQELRNERKR